MEYAFGPYVLSVPRLQLTRDGAPLPLEPQVFALLRHLIENRDRVVTRDELFEAIWKDREVSDAALSSRVKVARAAIGDDGARQGMIRTLHGRGFQFVAEVAERPGADGPVPDAARPSIALLPVAMLAPTDPQRAFGEGLAQDILSALGRVRTIYVASNPGEADPRRVASELGVRYLLSLRLQFSGDAFRLNAALLDARRMEEVWAGRFSGETGDPFAAQDHVTGAVLGALVPSMLMVEIRRAAEQDATADPSAYTQVLRATPLCWTTSAADNAAAIGHLGAAIDSDPDYGLAHALMSWCHGQQLAYVWTADPDATREAAGAHARAALRAAPRDGMVLTFVGHAEALAGHHAAADHHVRTALELEPASSWAWSRHAFNRLFLGSASEAVEAFETALRLSPHDPMRHSVYFGLGGSHFFLGDYAAGLRWLDQALIENPDMIWAHRAVAACAAELGDLDRARDSVAIIRSYLPEATAESLVQAVPVADPAYRAQLVASYRKAGF